MIGRLTDKKINIGGIGTSSILKPLIDSLGKEFDFKVSTTEDGFGPSDHASFYSKDKPVLFFLPDFIATITALQILGIKLIMKVKQQL